MLKALFTWLDGHPGSYWIIAFGATLLLAAWIAVAVWREFRGPVVPPRGAIWRDASVLFLFLLAWRWPFLLSASEYNPDESQLIAGAITLAHDPVFWRSVDGHTSGPLNFYALLPWSWFGAPLDYFTARLTGLLLIWGALFTCHRALAGSFGRAAAWLGILPTAAFFATVGHPDLVHYSTEHLPLLLIAVPIWLLARRQPADRARLWTACFVAGALPWTKLQTVPISLALIAWGGWQSMREPGITLKLRLRRAAGAGFAAILPTLLIAGMAVVTGQTEPALKRFILQNIIYVGNAAPLGKAMREMARLAGIDGRFPLLLAIALAVLFASTVYFVIRRVRPSALLVAGGLLTLTAAIAVVAPRHEFLHYALLLPVPLTIWMGAAMGGWWIHLSTGRARLLLAGVLFFAAGMPAVITRGYQSQPGMYGQFAYHWRHPRVSAAVLARTLAGPEGSLAVWGWANNFYVESGLPQATRDANSEWSIFPNANLDYHRACYLADLQRHQPAVFIDAVGPDAFALQDRATQAHEIFPALADYIWQNYTLVTDLGLARVYARNDLAALREMTPSRVEALIRQGR